MRAGRKRIWLGLAWRLGEKGASVVVSMYLYDVCEGAHLWRQMGCSPRFAADKAGRGRTLSRRAVLVRNRRKGNVFCIDGMV